MVDNREAQSSAVEHEYRGFEARERPISEPNGGIYDESAVVNAISEES
jgi:hypothetical protein